MRFYRLWRSGLLPAHRGRLAKRLSYFVPPVFMDGLRYLLSEWECLPQGWPAAGAGGEGWNAASVAAAQERHWPTLVGNLQGPGPLGVSHFVHSTTREDRADHNAMMSFGYVLARAARKKDAISMLDWGGSLGHYRLYGQALLPEVAIDYHCYELPRLCEAGRRLLPQAHFHEDASTVLGRRYDLVVSSSSLHYFEDWRDVARKLAAATGDFLYVARLQTVVDGDSFVVVQRPYASGYQTEYPSWFLSRSELVACLEGEGLELLREFIYAEDWLVRNAPAKGTSRGFLFRRRAQNEAAT
jgi:putative methyltransferase (TIGR04325 family)